MPFGRNVKMARIKRNFSLQHMAALSGVSASMISKIEREEKIPTIRVASQIARALQMSLAYLLDDGFYTSVAVVKKGQRKMSIDPVSKIESLEVSPFIGNEFIEILLQTIPKNSKTGIIPPHGEGIKKYIIVIKGRLLIFINADFYDLEEGDCIMFDANVAHEISNSGGGEAQYYLITGCGEKA